MEHTNLHDSQRLPDAHYSRYFKIDTCLPLLKQTNNSSTQIFFRR